MSSCTLLIVLVTVYYHRIAMLCFSYHVIYFFLSYTVPVHILYFSMIFIYFIYHLHFMSLILYFLYLYTCHFLLDFMSANTLEADTGNNYMYP